MFPGSCFAGAGSCLLGASRVLFFFRYVESSMFCIVEIIQNSFELHTPVFVQDWTDRAGCIRQFLDPLTGLA